ncbi:unnamed protein product [Rotaria socialis]|uniref:Uncharacterized protein n=2 Tax=Rotaria socialis TaxID=392032 RepID=A0A817XDJ9_9BILA|nr:unnamed protein product [Rotaria socialis]
MNKSKRTHTLDSFVIKTPNVISTIETNPAFDLHEKEVTSATLNSSETNINQDITTNAVNHTTNEIAPLSVGSELSPISIQNDDCSSNCPDNLLAMFKSTNNAKEFYARETYFFSDNILKLVTDLRSSCETFLLDCVNSRPVVNSCSIPW